jgi:hypothetical protein
MSSWKTSLKNDVEIVTSSWTYFVGISASTNEERKSWTTGMLNRISYEVEKFLVYGWDWLRAMLRCLIDCSGWGKLSRNGLSSGIDEKLKISTGNEIERIFVLFHLFVQQVLSFQLFDWLFHLKVLIYLQSLRSMMLQFSFIF